MAKVEISILFLFSLFCVAMPIPVRPIPRPLCAYQFNLVNYACARLQVDPFPPPSPSHAHSRSSRRSRSHGSSNHGHSSSSRRSRSRERRHRHRRGHRHGTDAQGYCCQWLNQLDNGCVCDLLAHLPLFLSRPYHRYTIVIGDACTVNFTCPGRLAP